MTEKEQKRASKFLSLVLRHKPEILDLSLDENGWIDTQELLVKMNANGRGLTFEQLQEVVENNDKNRFSFSAYFSRIRANQGHSVEVELGLREMVPPNFLYHGTSVKNLSSIIEKGINKGQRHHVHLSGDEATALKVGSRHGKPVVLPIQAFKMYTRGIKFYQSENAVWLTDYVSTEFIESPL